MEKIDLHIHSNYSDGSDSVVKLLEKVKNSGITTFALTDHDTISGCLEIIDKLPANIKFIPSVELTCLAGNIKCHILGYGCNPLNEKLTSLIDRGKVLRKDKLETRIAYLREKWGIELTQEELDWLYSRRSVVKTHLANILVQRGLSVDNVSAMKKYLDGCKTGNTRFDGQEAIDTILNAGGIPVWAHPLGGEGEEHLLPEMFFPKLEKMLSFGIKGLECFYSRYTKQEAEFLANCAKDNGLYVSAGSDYHGDNKNGIFLGQLSSDSSSPEISDVTILKVL